MDVFIATQEVNAIRWIGQVQFEEFINILDISLLESIKRKQDVIQNVKAYGKKEIADLMKWENHSLLSWRRSHARHQRF